MFLVAFEGMCPNIIDGKCIAGIISDAPKLFVEMSQKGITRDKFVGSGNVEFRHQMVPNLVYSEYDGIVIAGVLSCTSR